MEKKVNQNIITALEMITAECMNTKDCNDCPVCGDDGCMLDVYDLGGRPYVWDLWLLKEDTKDR